MKSLPSEGEYDLYKIEPTQVAPTTLKKFASNYGAASKHKMIESAIKLGWTIAENDDDGADAAHTAELARAMHSFRTIRLTRRQLEVLDVLGVKLK